MLTILKDAEARSDLFHWFGAIERDEIESWMRTGQFSVPSELVELWSLTGGGDLFESETIFRPTSIRSSMPYFVAGSDPVDSANEQRVRNGMPKSYLAFHDGLFLSAIRLYDQRVVTLTPKGQETGEFSSLDEWYLRTLRAEFSRRYGLSA
jgi:hypothetical protein